MSTWNICPPDSVKVILKRQFQPVSLATKPHKKRGQTVERCGENIAIPCMITCLSVEIRDVITLAQICNKNGGGPNTISDIKESIIQQLLSFTEVQLSWCLDCPVLSSWSKLGAKWHWNSLWAECYSAWLCLYIRMKLGCRFNVRIFFIKSNLRVRTSLALKFNCSSFPPNWIS